MRAARTAPVHARRTVGSGGHDAPLVVDAAYIAQLKAAAQAPISVALMTSLPWSVDASKTAGCTLHGVPLDCRFDAQPTQVRRCKRQLQHLY